MSGVIIAGTSMADALTHDEGDVRALARLAGSNVSEALLDWFKAELARPDANVGDMLVALSRWSTQAPANFSAQFTNEDPEAIASATTLLHAVIDNEYSATFLAVKAIKKRQRQ